MKESKSFFELPYEAQREILNKSADKANEEEQMNKPREGKKGIKWDT